MYYQYVCLDCGWIYDEAKGWPEKGIAPGTRWEELPDDFQCAECDTQKREARLWQKL
ncbi:MAG: rubredoxin [Candidatus Pacebacteria bacterium]|nr:rubredoxin [Candidatus Paceibacterota bacterium]